MAETHIPPHGCAFNAICASALVIGIGVGLRGTFAATCWAMNTNAKKSATCRSACRDPNSGRVVRIIIVSSVSHHEGLRTERNCACFDVLCNETAYVASLRPQSSASANIFVVADGA